MPSPRNASKIGWAVRIYSNAAGEKLGLHDISIMESVQKITMSKFHRSLWYTESFMHINYTDTTDRVVAKIKMIGDYYTIKSDYSSAEWLTEGNNVNSVMIFSERLYSIGDEISEH